MIIKVDITMSKYTFCTSRSFMLSQGAAEPNTKKQYEAGNKYVKPNRTSFNSVIKRWVRNEGSQVAMEKAEALIDYVATMSQRDPDFLPPCRRGYNLLLYANAHSGLADAGEQAETILNEMLKGADDDSIAPDITTAST